MRCCKCLAFLVLRAYFELSMLAMHHIVVANDALHHWLACMPIPYLCASWHVPHTDLRQPAPHQLCNPCLHALFLHKTRP